MSCKDGLHGALFCNYLRNWSCLLCGEDVDYDTTLKKKRTAVQESVPKPSSKGEIELEIGVPK